MVLAAYSYRMIRGNREDFAGYPDGFREGVETVLREIAHCLEDVIWKKLGDDPIAYMDKATIKLQIEHLAPLLIQDRRHPVNPETAAIIYKKAMAEGHAPLNRCKVIFFGQVGTCKLYIWCPFELTATILFTYSPGWSWQDLLVEGLVPRTLQ